MFLFLSDNGMERKEKVRASTCGTRCVGLCATDVIASRLHQSCCNLL